MSSDFKLLLVIAESSLETVPRELWGHPSVVKSARRRGKPPSRILLDRSLHHQAMKKLPMSWKRGRPDIVHFSLLEALGSPLNKEGMLETIVHTIADIIIQIDPSTRLPRNYNRFVGLMEQLFEFGRVPPGSANPLIWISKAKLEEHLSGRRVIMLWERGECVKLRDLANRVVSLNDPAIVVGGFPHGDFSERVLGLADEKYCIYGGRPLETWVVVSSVLSAIAMRLDLF
ncbi:MAG: 16S rRNA methyltransferase [Pyrodictiaceae archaeon]